MQSTMRVSRKWEERHVAGWTGIGLVLALIFLFAGTASAQVDQGTITGTVTDLTGAVVPNAQVTLTNTGTGLVLQSATNKSGTYVFSPVKIGSYTVSATAQGFSTTTLPGLTLNVNQRLLANLQLHTGDVNQTVTVQAGAEQLLQ